ncbi:FKBP-type peptidyl-prolyl cis-trans isomerase [Microbacterium sp. ASV81]|uniref:peptidylprolyl isomerase n=1 Tax=Microbacterium capsulatum TaxID=3041921 RepID=A0ABU0XB79_9MICO|nr:FKBP-type peptidyl-prolyl cis-trans isomerase [Microbacterium sp. ASV81]MDQ4212365.1 FKBP-type peptidyl-prolyl cis-trans isomerase [Microbacterium sp. ASV81]
MRIRLAAALSAVAATALLLSGCAGSGSPSASPSASSSSACLLDAKPGKASNAVKVEGSGKDMKVTVPSGTDVDAGNSAQRTVVTKGKGGNIAAGDYVSVRFQIVDATDNTVLATSSTATDGVQPLIFGSDPQQPTLLDVALECKPVGTAVVMTVPSSLRGEGQKPLVVYAQAVKELPTVATGKAVAPEAGLPTVKLDKSGKPSITVPKSTPPTETKVAVLKQGDGATVGSGDYVVVQYLGVTWADGKTFDSSWQRNAPAQFQTTQVVPGFKKALEGQKVGSQVLAVIPPADGYGDKASGSIPANSTLVFVVDILGTVPAGDTTQ